MEAEEGGCFDDLLEPAILAAEQARARRAESRTDQEPSNPPRAPAGRQRAPVGLRASFDQGLIDAMRRQGDPLMARHLENLAKATGRVYLCARCVRNEEETRRHVPEWTPNPAHSFVGFNGLRYWDALCVGCARIESDQRKRMRGSRP